MEGTASHVQYGNVRYQEFRTSLQAKLIIKTDKSFEECDARCSSSDRTAAKHTHRIWTRHSVQHGTSILWRYGTAPCIDLFLNWWLTRCCVWEAFFFSAFFCWSAQKHCNHTFLHDLIVFFGAFIEREPRQLFCVFRGAFRESQCVLSFPKFKNVCACARVFETSCCMECRH